MVHSLSMKQKDEGIEILNGIDIFDHNVNIPLLPFIDNYHSNFRKIRALWRIL